MKCCNYNESLDINECIRKDGKKFKLPRKFSKKRCLEGTKGFSMKSSCAPFKFCLKGGKSKKKKFLYNPNNPKKSFDVYINKNPSDTISIKYTTIDDVKNTIKNLEKLFKNKKYSHKRIWQVGMIMKVRLETINKYKKTKYKKAKNVYKRFKLSKKYFDFLSLRSKKETFKERKNMVFKF